MNRRPCAWILVVALVGGAAGCGGDRFEATSDASDDGTSSPFLEDGAVDATREQDSGAGREASAEGGEDAAPIDAADDASRQEGGADAGGHDAADRDAAAADARDDGDAQARDSG